MVAGVQRFNPWLKHVQATILGFFTRLPRTLTSLYDLHNFALPIWATHKPETSSWLSSFYKHVVSAVCTILLPFQGDLDLPYTNPCPGYFNPSEAQGSRNPERLPPLSLRWNSKTDMRACNPFLGDPFVGFHAGLLFLCGHFLCWVGFFKGKSKGKPFCRVLPRSNSCLCSGGSRLRHTDMDEQGFQSIYQHTDCTNA